MRCETLQEDYNTLLFGTSSTDKPTCSVDNSDIGCITKSCAIAFYAICFSVIKHCSYWNSDTSDAIVEHGNAFFIEITKYQEKSSQLPQNVSIYGANINVNFVLKSKGTLSSNFPSSKLVLERLILQSAIMNTGFLLHFPMMCFSCVYHKTSRNATFFLICLNENQELDIHKESDANSVVQRVCEYITIKLNGHETEYYIQCVSCTCPLEKREKQKILKCHKSSNQENQNCN